MLVGRVGWGERRGSGGGEEEKPHLGNEDLHNNNNHNNDDKSTPRAHTYLMQQSKEAQDRAASLLDYCSAQGSMATHPLGAVARKTLCLRGF